MLMFILIFCVLCSFDTPKIDTKEFSFLKLNSLLKCAETGDVQCMSSMATAYCTGLGVKIDYHEAISGNKKLQKLLICLCTL